MSADLDSTWRRLSRPNILLISTDQQRFDAMGCYGNRHIDTPNLDRLAEQGVVFENCYVQNPVCAPSRASLMTGQYVLRARPVGERRRPAARQANSSPRTLADAGYDCGLVGKFHLGGLFGGRTEPRLDDGFRVFRWAHDPYPGSPENAYHRWLSASHPDLYAGGAATGPRGRSGHHADRGALQPLGRRGTIDFLPLDRETDKPFFLVTNFFDPHHPFGAPEEYLRRYDAWTSRRSHARGRARQQAADPDRRVQRATRGTPAATPTTPRRRSRRSHGLLRDGHP